MSETLNWYELERGDFTGRRFPVQSNEASYQDAHTFPGWPHGGEGGTNDTTSGNYPQQVTQVWPGIDWRKQDGTTISSINVDVNEGEDALTLYPIDSDAIRVIYDDTMIAALVEVIRKVGWFPTIQRRKGVFVNVEWIQALLVLYDEWQALTPDERDSYTIPRGIYSDGFRWYTQAANLS